MLTRRGWIFGAIALAGAGLTLPGLAQAQTQTPEVSQQGRGTAVIVPYYTVVDGWETLLNITNTSAHSLAVKLHLHEARNGRNVLQFTLLLSPFDVWAGWLRQDSDGRPVLRTTDRSCTVPLSVRDTGMVADETAYSTSDEAPLDIGRPGRFTDHSATDRDLSRMQEGYATVLVMGEASWQGSFGSVPWFAAHNSGEPRDCDRVEAAFAPQDSGWTGARGSLPGRDGTGTPSAAGPDGYSQLSSPAPLKVNVTLVARDKGAAAGIPTTALEGWGVGQKLVTAAAFPWHLEPTLASHQGLWSVQGLGAVHAALDQHSLANEWAVNNKTGASSDWVLTFPTKRFATDVHAGDISAGCNVWRNGGEEGDAFDGWDSSNPERPRRVVRRSSGQTFNNCPTASGYEQAFQQSNDGVATLVGGEFRVFGRDGGAPMIIDGDNALIEPPGHVANVLAFSDIGEASALDSPSASRFNEPIAPSGLQNGWINLRFFVPEGGPSVLKPPGPNPEWFPVLGFVFKMRDFGSPERNFAQAMPHATQPWR